MEKKSMGSFLTVLRKARGLTQKQLAEKLNVSDKAVSRWERDECAPDLSLIPVLAEIYGVTSDEILRGQRMDPEKQSLDYDRSKAEKQRNRILHSTKTKFLCRSIVTVALSLVGVLLAYILNSEFSKANAGFLVGCIFFVTAAVSQILLLFNSFGTVSDEEWQDSSVENCKGFMILASQWCMGIIAASIAFCIPLAGQSSVPFSDCISSGIPWIFVLTAVWLIISITINLCLKRKGIVDLKQPLNKLRLRYGRVLAVIFVMLLGLQFGMNRILNDNKHLYAPHETHTDVRLFANLMAEPKTEKGFSMYLYDDTHDVWVFYIDDYENYESLMIHGYHSQTPYMLHKDEILKELVPTDAEHPDGKRSLSKEYGYQFNHLNRTIAHYEINSEEEVLPIYTFTTQELDEANRNFVYINLFYLATYALTIGITALFYNYKKQKL